MTAPLTGVGGTAGALHALGESPARRPENSELLVKQKFQEFVAGTFYKQMLKALRRMHGKPAYFHGGQAEEIFRSQLDQHVAEDLARDQGAAFAEPLFASFVQQIRPPHSDSRPPQVEQVKELAAPHREDSRKGEPAR